MKINLRWLIQAAAFIGCIFFFMQIWNASKAILSSNEPVGLLLIGVYCLGFLVCFFIMGLTSYLKQRNNNTLKNPIPFFEKFLTRFGLTDSKAEST